MKVTIEKKEKVEIEVTLPLFSKHINTYYKVEETQTTQISIWQDEVSVKVHRWAMEYPCAYEQITEDEFNEVRTKAQQFI